MRAKAKTEAGTRSSDPYEIRCGVLLRCSSERDVPFDIPPGVRVIGASVFTYHRPPRHLVIPEGVEVIEMHAFADCKGLTSVSFPRSLRYVGRGAFVDCYELEEVTFEEGVEAIGEDAFANDRNLRQVNFPSTLREIGKKAFTYTGLRQIRLPDGISSLEEDVFYGVDIDCLIAPGLTIWTGFAHDAVRPKKLILPRMPFSEIPKEFRLAALLGFAEWEVRKKPMDPAVRRSCLLSLRRRAPYLQEEALANPALLSLILQKQMLSRESVELFLEKVQRTRRTDAAAMLLDYLGRLPPSDPERELAGLMRELDTGETDIARFSASWRFRRKQDGTVSLMEYLGTEPLELLPSFAGTAPVTELESGAFKDRTDLRSILIPDQVQVIGSHAFAGCVHLTRAELPERMEKLSSECFQGCSSLREIRLPAGLTYIPAGCFQGCTSLTEIRIPEGVDRIFWNAFADCAGLTRVFFPVSLRVIDSNAFSCCNARAEFHIPGERYWMMNELARARTQLSRIVFSSRDPQRCPTDWDRSDFKDCDNLESIHIPAHIRAIDCNTFYYCRDLRDWTSDPANPWLYTKGPYLISRKEKRLLLAVPRLESEAVLPDDILEISERALYRCSRITSVTIPATVRIIRKDAFALCTCLRTVRFLGAPQEIARSAFRRCPAGKRLALPEGSRWV